MLHPLHPLHPLRTFESLRVRPDAAAAMLRFEADPNLTYASSNIVIENLNVYDGPNEQITADKVTAT